MFPLPALRAIDIAILSACFAVPALFIAFLHWTENVFFSPLRQSGDGQFWLVLVAGEFLFLMSRFVRGK